MLADQVKKLRGALDLEPAAMDIRNLFPMFAPASFFATGGWPGPSEKLGAGGIGMTWALALVAGGMRYLDRRMCAHWESAKVDWKAEALANLRAATPDIFTHRLGRKDGSGVFAGAMMHPDGWGPSRLLLRGTLEKAFPEGYRVAIPEMSCGVAFSRRLDAEEESAVKGIVANCFRQGTRPLAQGIYDAQEILPMDMRTSPGR